MNEDVALEVALLEEQRKECEFAVRDAQWTIRQKMKEIRQIDSKLKRLEKVKP
jgi:hypothetical protein